MSLVDIIIEAFRNVWVRRGRTLLNMVGVVISCVLLLCTLAGATGVRNAIADFVENSSEALKFRVYTDYDRSVVVPASELAVDEGIASDRKKRVERMLENKWRRKNTAKPRFITAEQLDALRSMNHVTDVVPVQNPTCSVTVVAANEVSDSAGTEATTQTNPEKVTPNEQSVAATVQRQRLSGESALNSSFRERIILGQSLDPSHPDRLVIHENLAFELGFESDEELEQLIGVTLQLDFGGVTNPIDSFVAKLSELSPEEQQNLFGIVERLLAGQTTDLANAESVRLMQKVKKASVAAPNNNEGDGSPANREVRLQIGGIVRGQDDEDVSTFLSMYFGQGQLMVHHSRMDEIARGLGSEGVSNAIVYVDEVGHLDETIEAVKELNLRPLSALRIVQTIYEAIERSKYSALLVGAIILLVAAVGISNTMIISLIERSEEIGIMKAIGGSNRCITAIVLLEGFITGATGGVIAVGIAWVVTRVGDSILKNYVQQRIALPLKGNMFVLEPWMIVATIGSAALVATLAGVWPARRAAKMDPIKAMSES
ncbi:MAG: FtsX-like permease family protein [Planctomycetota bacterium]